nr:hypothetical protein [uncultured Kingella sp.]
MGFVHVFTLSVWVVGKARIIKAVLIRPQDNLYLLSDACCGAEGFSGCLLDTTKGSLKNQIPHFNLARCAAAYP